MAFRRHGPTDYVNVQRITFTTKWANRNLHLLHGPSRMGGLWHSYRIRSDGDRHHRGRARTRRVWRTSTDAIGHRDGAGSGSAFDGVAGGMEDLHAGGI